MNLTLPATAASVELGLSLVADAIRADLKSLGYIVDDVIVIHQSQVGGAGHYNRSSLPWTIAAFLMVKGERTHFQTYGHKVEYAFDGLIAKLPAATEANA